MTDLEVSARWGGRFLDACADLRAEFPIFNAATIMTVAGRPGKTTIRWIGLIGECELHHDNTNGRIR